MAASLETSAERETQGSSESFFSDVLKPGSSLNPTFLAILDGAFTLLFVVLSSLAYITSGNLHIFALMAIELGLWASVKWFVNEIKKAPIVARNESESKKEL